MSRHEGVICDACMIQNFVGFRFKCLVCQDYDLCLLCHSKGLASAQHQSEHPMQCILARADAEVFFGGEASGSEPHQQSYVCPFCGQMGLTDLVLIDHVSMEHPDGTLEVLCPICTCLSTGGDSNLLFDDLLAHLMLEHRTPTTELDVQHLNSIRAVRRIPHHGRSAPTARTRRSMKFQSSSSSALTMVSPAVRDRDAMDPIAELLSQLSTVRSRMTAHRSISSQLQQLEMQLQTSRYLSSHQISDRIILPSLREAVMSSGAITFPQMLAEQQHQQLQSVVGGMVPPVVAPSTESKNVYHEKSNADSSYFLLSRLNDQSLSEDEKETTEEMAADRSFFVQDLLLALQTETSSDLQSVNCLQTVDVVEDQKSDDSKPDGFTDHVASFAANNSSGTKVETSVTNGSLLDHFPAATVWRLHGSGALKYGESSGNILLPDGKVPLARQQICGKQYPVVGRTGKEKPPAII